MNVLDASAVLAWLQQEPGANAVRECLDGGLITAANWSEVMQKTQQHGGDAGEVAVLLQALGLEVVPVTRDDGEEAARIWSRARSLSLADRLCLAAAMRLACPVVTAESGWSTLESEIGIKVIR